MTAINNKISAVLVLHNEEKDIKKCLESIADVVDEIVVIHDGKCTDDTLKICKRYTTRIYIEHQIGSAQPHRVLSYKHAKYNWILQMDADEYLSDSLKTNIRNLVKEDVGIYNVKWMNIGPNNATFYRYKGILFQKSKVYFIGVIQEYVKPINKNIIIRQIEDELIHTPPIEDWSLSIFSRKWFRWIGIHVQYLTTDFKNVPKWNYPYDWWDFPTSVRLKYPLVVGALGSLIYHWLSPIKFIGSEYFWEYVKYEFRTGLYLFIVYIRFTAFKYRLLFKRLITPSP